MLESLFIVSRSKIRIKISIRIKFSLRVSIIMSTMRQFRVSSLCITGWLLAVYTILSHIIWMLHVPIPMNPMELEMTSIRRITTNSQMEENTNINIDENTNDGNNNDDNNLLDQVSRDELPIIYPNTFIVREGPSFGELVHATWPKRDNKATRQYGVGPLAQDPPQGETVEIGRAHV